jgi:hypothetical protein
MPLTREEIKVCRDAFDTFDRDGSGSVDLLELKQCLSGLGSTPSDEELAQMIHLVSNPLLGWGISASSASVSGASGEAVDESVVCFFKGLSMRRRVKSALLGAESAAYADDVSPPQQGNLQACVRILLGQPLSCT